MHRSNKTNTDESISLSHKIVTNTTSLLLSLDKGEENEEIFTDDLLMSPYELDLGLIIKSFIYLLIKTEM